MIILPRYTVLTLLLLLSFKSSKGQLTIDHAYHFTAGATVGLFVSNTSTKPFLVTLLSTTALGVGKEIVDRKNGKRFDYTDAGATVLGGLITASIVKLLKRKHEIHRLARAMP